MRTRLATLQPELLLHLLKYEDDINDIYDSLAEASVKAYEKQQDGLNTIIDLTKEMIKQEAENQVDALEKQIEAFEEIIDLKKESLNQSKKENDYNKSVADKTKEIAKIQSQINKLSLDDSREAQAERIGLEEQLAELQGTLS